MAVIYDLTKRTGGITGWTTEGIADNSEPNGAITITGTKVRAFAFYNKFGITSVSMPNCTYVLGDAFTNCTNITNINAPELTNLEGGHNFSCGKSGYSLYLPKCYHTNAAAPFQKCKFSTVVLPSWTEGAQYMFENATVTTVDYKPSTISANAFKGSTIDTIIMRGTSVATLANVNAFTTSNVFKSGGTGGTIYIPKSLYDHLGDGTSSDYKAATNWSTIDGYGTITWKSIESTHTDPNAPIDLTLYYADGTPIPTT